MANPVSLNRILSRLSPDEFGFLQPHLEAVDLPVRKYLETRNKAIEHVYFIERGFAPWSRTGRAAASRSGLSGGKG